MLGEAKKGVAGREVCFSYLYGRGESESISPEKLGGGADDRTNRTGESLWAYTRIPVGLSWPNLSLNEGNDSDSMLRSLESYMSPLLYM